MVFWHCSRQLCVRHSTARSESNHSNYCPLPLTARRVPVCGQLTCGHLLIGTAVSLPQIFAQFLLLMTTICIVWRMHLATHNRTYRWHSDCVPQSPTWEAKSSSASKEIPRISYKPKAYYPIHNIPITPYPEPDQSITSSLSRFF